MRDSIFISYSREDSRWADRFEEMLATQGDHLRYFRDTSEKGERIVEGDDWRSRLQAEISRARVALLLVSPRFFSSGFVTRRELPWLLQARSQGLSLKWVKLEPTLLPSEFEDDLTRLQAFKPKSGAGPRETRESLSELEESAQAAEIKRICEELVDSLSKDSHSPRRDFMTRVADVVHRRFGYSIFREVAVRENSVAYCADAPGERVLVQAQTPRLLQSAEMSEDDRQA